MCIEWESFLNAILEFLADGGFLVRGCFTQKKAGLGQRVLQILGVQESR